MRRTTVARAHDEEPVTPLELARRVAGLSLTELATLSGVSRMTIHKLEHANQSPTLDTAQRLAVALKSSVDALFPIAEAKP
jgi:putative transcriptional regulator